MAWVWGPLQPPEASAELRQAPVSEPNLIYCDLSTLPWSVRAGFYIYRQHLLPFSSQLVLMWNAEASSISSACFSHVCEDGRGLSFALYKHSHCPAFHSKPCSLKLPHYANITTLQVPVCFSGNDFKSKLEVYRSKFLGGSVLQAAVSFKSLIVQQILL